VPFNWDQRNTLNATVTVGHPDSYWLSGIIKAGSGTPYTPALASASSTGLEANSGRKPSSVVVDMRGEWTRPLSGVPIAVFMRVFNLFDQRFVNGPVFATSGSPYYSRFPLSDQVALADPTRFYLPRRVELGFSVASQGWR
jgi:hypothetical protein